MFKPTKSPATGVERSTTPHQANTPNWMFPDLILCVFGLFVLVEYGKAKSNYATLPFCWVIIAAFANILPSYRNINRERLAKVWGQSLRYSQGSREIPWISAVLFAAVPCWFVYISNQKTLGATDTRPVIPTAVSLLREGDSELGEYFTSSAKLSLRDKGGIIRTCFRRTNGGIYSSYPAGMVPFAIVATGFAGGAGSDLLDFQIQRRLEKVTAAVVAAAATGLFFLTALRLAPPGPAIFTTMLLAIGSGMFSTVSMALWQHGGVVFWSTLILFIEFHVQGKPSWRTNMVQGLSCGMLVSCRLTSISFLVPYGVWIAIRNPKRAFLVVGVALLVFLPWTTFYINTYGNPFGPSMSFLESRLWELNPLTPLIGVLASPSRGLLIYQPWILLLPLGLLNIPDNEWSHQPTPLGWRMFCLIAIGTHILLIAVWGCWWGGWCWGSRLLVDIIPLCGLICVRPVATLSKSRSGMILIVSLAIISIVMQAAGVYWNTSRWNASATLPDDLWSWRRAPFLEPLKHGQ